MPTTALTTKLLKKNKDQFLLHASLSAPLQEHSVSTSPRDSISTEQILNMETEHMDIRLPFSVHYWQRERGLAVSLEWRNILHLLLLPFSAAENAGPGHLPIQVGEPSVPGALTSVPVSRSHHLIQHKGRKRNTGKWCSMIKPSSHLASLWSDRIQILGFPASGPQPLQNIKMVKGFLSEHKSCSVRYFLTKLSHC